MLLSRNYVTAHSYGPDPRKVDTSGASYAAVVRVAEILVSHTLGVTRLHQECRLRVLQNINDRGHILGCSSLVSSR